MYMYTYIETKDRSTLQAPACGCPDRVTVRMGAPQRPFFSLSYIYIYIYIYVSVRWRARGKDGNMSEESEERASEILRILSSTLK